MVKDSKLKSDNVTTLEVITGLHQAAANAHHGATVDGKGYKAVKIGLRREEDIDFREKKFMDGFKILINGNNLRLLYQSEIRLKEIYQKDDFEKYIIGLLDDIVAFLKKEYKKITQKTLTLTKVGEPIVQAEYMNKVRSWVTAVQNYRVEGITPMMGFDGDNPEERLDSSIKKFLKLQDKYPASSDDFDQESTRMQ